jgi:methylenetetrahydrofolate reductase (NADPH)
MTLQLDLAAAIQRCPKQMRSGPCGGVRPEGACEVSATLRCPYLDVADQLPWRVTTDVRAGGGHNQTAQGRLAHKLRCGEFAVIAELWPPDTVDLTARVARYAVFAEQIDAVNIANNPLASPHLSTLATAAIFERHGFATIMNLTARDHNRIGLQAELLGAAALGVQNVFCITGDHPALGDHPQARGVFEVDSFGLLTLARRLRDDGQFESGRILQAKPTYLIGAAGSPFSAPLALQAERTAAKVFAGAEFIQTQAVFAREPFATYVTRLQELGALAQAWLIAGVGVITRLEQAEWLDAHVPGAQVPAQLIDQLRATPPSERRRVGLRYTAALIAELRTVPAVSGVLLFAMDDDVESLGELLNL